MCLSVMGVHVCCSVMVFMCSVMGVQGCGLCCGCLCVEWGVVRDVCGGGGGAGGVRCGVGCGGGRGGGGGWGRGRGGSVISV